MTAYIESNPFWKIAGEKLFAPSEVNYVLHTLNPHAAIKIGCSLSDLLALIRKNGLFAPLNRSVLTLKFDIDWSINTNDAPPSDLIYLTETAPTSESGGVMRDNITYGLPLRDPVIPIQNIPVEVRKVYPNTTEFVHVPPQDLQAEIQWESFDHRSRYANAVRKILSQAAKSDDMSIVIEAIISTLRKAPIIFLNTCNVDEMLFQIALNNIDVYNRRETFKQLWKSYIGA